MFERIVKYVSCSALRLEIMEATVSPSPIPTVTSSVASMTSVAIIRLRSMLAEELRSFIFPVFLWQDYTFRQSGIKVCGTDLPCDRRPLFIHDRDAATYLEVTRLPQCAV